MTEIEVQPLDTSRFGMRVREGDVTADLEVDVPPDLGDELGVDAGPDEIARESVAFLLEREAASAIPTRPTPDAIHRRFEDYYDELYRRLTAAHPR